MTALEDQARSIFLAALERTPGQWPAFLEEACRDHAELRVRVDQLLRAHQAMGSIRGGGAVASVSTVDDPIMERLDTVVGPYKLLEQIGEGGFGIVFMAEQSQPVRRKVALKVLKPGMDSRPIVARFEAERQALALMDHPNIARVLDGGETATGRPYFVMELVKGVPITEFCDRNNLSIPTRLGLFGDVCQAVQHAHQKGIIHRDIKPSNVLVMLQDGAPVVKVIDFGIAKALGRQLTDKTVFTGFAQMIGTPLYMSPEQAGLGGLDVDTRSDIYSLGVLLYELLVGTTPFDEARFQGADYDEIRRIIREEEPPKPSTRLGTLGQAAISASSRRRSDPKQLSRLLRGELDWIVMQCLDKDRDRRYQTAGALAAEVWHYLSDEVVEARPPSAWYRLRKFVRRNKVLVRVALLLLLALIAVGIGMARTRRATIEKEAAEEREAKAKEMLEFVENKLFAAAWPGRPRPEETPQLGWLDFLPGQVPLFIALVPDPLDPNSAQQFDTSVDAIQRSAERHGYLLDRAWFPWKASGPGNGTPAVEEDVWRDPGGRLAVLVFRKDGSRPPQYLVVFLVRDTTIHGMAR
jgi:serine/threonine protein kinase